MRNIRNRLLSPGQLQDSVGQIQQASLSAGSPDAKVHYSAEQSDVPRPAFELFQASLAATGKLVKKDKRLLVGPSASHVLQAFPGLRGIASYLLQTAGGATNKVTGPAIILADGRHVAILVAEAESQAIGEIQQAMLEQEYLKAQAEVATQHSERDVSNAGLLAPSLVLVTTVATARSHADLHSLAAGAGFGPNFANSGRQNLHFGRGGHNVYKPFTTHLAVNSGKVLFATGPQDQLPINQDLFDIQLSASERAVGMALAATVSRGEQPNLLANITVMVEA